MSRMHPTDGVDLGHGVSVVPGPGGELIVVSRELDLGLRAGEGRSPGTAVIWEDAVYVVASRAPAGRGARWVLLPWTEATAMRDVIKLDGGTVAACARATAETRRRDRGRLWSAPLLPLLGLAPASFQMRWSQRWGFSAAAATISSALVELGVGGLGLVQSVALAVGGDWFVPSWLAWLAFAGPPLCLEGMVRLTVIGGQQEPLGSLLGLPLALLERRPPAVRDRPVPEVRLVDEAAGILELVSSEHRADWDGDGVLTYRGRTYRLSGTDREGPSWVYRFEACDARDGTPLKLVRRETPTALQQVRVEPPSVVLTTLVTAAVTLGPRVDQERWAAHLGLSPLWLTAIGAGAELIGGVANFRRDVPAGSPMLIALDLFLVGEGGLRLASAVTGRPMGSVFGWLLRPLYRRHLPP